jgi:cytochrome c peroxidase
MQTRVMSGHRIGLALGSFSVCFASSGWAQGSLEQGKTAAQLYAANCAECHKSPQSVTKTSGAFGLESYLREHYTPSPQSAATIAAYLEGLERQSSGSVRARGAKQSSQAHAPKPSPSETKEDKSSIARALNSAADTAGRAFNSASDTAERTLNRLLQAIKPEKNWHGGQPWF